MADENPREVQVWALATEQVSVPPFADDGPMTSERLSELRTVLAALANVPVATLEVHPLPAEVDRSGGIALGNTSSLAKHLSDLISQGPKAGAGTSAEALYRMVVPAKIAKQFGSGILQPMLSKSVPGGIHSALTKSSGIGGQAAFVKVAGAGVGGGAPIVVPGLIMIAVAAGLSMQIEASRREITGLLKKQLQAKLDDERNTLDGCRNPIEKATAILLDQGAIGQSVGLSTKVGAIEDAIAAANTPGTALNDAIEVLLKGPEISLVDHDMVPYYDFESKKPRTDARVRWWEQDAATLPALAELRATKLENGDPYPVYEPRAVDAEHLDYVYTDKTPLFYGHYWREWEFKQDEWTTYTACVDFSGGTGTMVAYRWSGESEIDWENYVPHDPQVVARIPADETV